MKPAPPLAGLLGLVGLTVLNDLAFIALQSASSLVIAADYAVRLVIVAALAASPLAREALRRALRPVGGAAFLLWSAGIVAASFAVAKTVGEPLDRLFPETVLFRFSAPPSAALAAIDLTFGLALIALSEEWLGRVYFRAVVAPRLSDGAAMAGLSGAAFALMHWSGGVADVVCAFPVGVLFMLSYMRTGSIRPALAAHLAINLIGFW